MTSRTRDPKGPQCLRSYSWMVPQPSVAAPDLAACAARRSRLSARLGDAALLLAAGEPPTRSGDTRYRFRPDSNFYYLTGAAEPGAVLLLRPGRAPASVLFLPVQDERDVLYHGRRPSADEAREQLGESVAVYLEAGEAGSGVPSTIVDGTGVVPRILREGAVSLAELREVVPTVVGAGEPEEVGS